MDGIHPGEPVILRLPYPKTGVQLFDDEGKEVKGGLISLDQLIEMSMTLTPKPDTKDGAMFQVDSESYAVCEDRILAWSFEGYREASIEELPKMVDVLTPQSLVKTFAAGFRPEFHSSARDLG